MDKEQAIEQARKGIGKLNDPAWQIAVLHGMRQATDKDIEKMDKLLSDLYGAGVTDLKKRLLENVDEWEIEEKKNWSATKFDNYEVAERTRLLISLFFKEFKARINKV